jgi:hypothetical protein
MSSSKDPTRENAAGEPATSDETEALSSRQAGASPLEELLAARPKSLPGVPGEAWPEGHVVATCTDDRHPTLAGRVRVRWENPRGHVCECWATTLSGLAVRVADRVLVLKLPHELDPVVLGVVDGFSRRPEVPRSVAQVLEMRGDETLQINADRGQPLVEITRNQQGPVLRLLQADTQIELSGRLSIAAAAIDLRARAGGVRIDASDDVEIAGEAIHLN